jgi:hypothetical protein
MFPFGGMASVCAAITLVPAKADRRARRAAFSGHLLRQGQAGASLSRGAPSW